MTIEQAHREEKYHLSLMRETNSMYHDMTTTKQKSRMILNSNWRGFEGWMDNSQNVGRVLQIHIYGGVTIRFIASLLLSLWISNDNHSFPNKTSFAEQLEIFLLLIERGWVISIAKWLTYPLSMITFHKVNHGYVQHNHNSAGQCLYWVAS